MTQTIYESRDQLLRSHCFIVQRGTMKVRVGITDALRLDLVMPIIVFAWTRGEPAQVFYSLN